MGPEPTSAPDAADLGYPNSTLDVAPRSDRVELLADSARPIGESAWITIDDEHFVDDVTAMR